MKTYLFQMLTATGTLPWEFSTEFPSDAMALDYAKRIFAYDQALRHGALALLVWLPDSTTGPLAKFVLDAPIVRQVTP